MDTQQRSKFRIIALMVFRHPYQFVTKTPVNFSPPNHNSNIFRLDTRGATPPAGSVESGDGAELLKYLNGRVIEALGGMPKSELDRICTGL